MYIMQSTERSPNPQESANFFSRIFFTYTIPIFFKGLRKDITVLDVPVNLEKHSAEILCDRFEIAWKKEITSNKQPSLYNTIINLFGLEYLMLGVLAIVFEVIAKITFSTCILRLLTAFDNNRHSTEYYLYAIGIVTSCFFHVLLKHNYILLSDLLGMKLRIGLSALVYKKSLLINRNVFSKKIVNDIVSLLSIDAFKLDRALVHVHSLWICLIEIIIIYYILNTELGYTATLGIFFVFLFLPLQLCMCKISFFAKTSAFKKYYERVQIINKLIYAIEMIKLWAWEKPVINLMMFLRRLETQKIHTVLFLKALFSAFGIFVQRTAQAIPIIGFALEEQKLCSHYVFSIVAFYFILSRTIIMIVPEGIRQALELKLSVDKIQEFLIYKDTTNATSVTKTQIKHTKSVEKLVVNDLDGECYNSKIVLQNVSAKWYKSGTTNVISNVTMKLEKSGIFAIIGPVGSGKTSLLQVILKQMPVIFGKVEVEGVISYASQDPWIFDGTVQQNILFEDPMNTEQYLNVIRSCALERDIHHLVHGDQTFIGKQEMFLTEGQKVKINLARAIYKQADIYILDDPFSSVDADVAKYIFEDCVLKLLKNKCVLFVSHNIQYLKHAKIIFLMDNGNILYQGSYSDLKNSNIQYTKDFDPYETTMSNTDTRKSFLEQSTLINYENKSKDLIQPEVFSSNVYIEFLNIAGTTRFFQIIISYGVLFFIAHASDYFLLEWVDLTPEVDNNSTELIKPELAIKRCVRIYTILIFLVIILSLIISVSFFNYCERASRKLHLNMFMSVISAPMKFFHTNHVATILKRFSYDLRMIDFVMPRVGADMIKNFYQLIAVVMVICIANPWVVVPTGIVLFLYYLIFVLYLSTHESIYNLERFARNKIVSHSTSCLYGLSTVRAFRMEKTLESEYYNHQNVHTSIWFLYAALSRAFGFWLDLISIIYMGLIIFIFCFVNVLNSSNLGLAVTQILLLLGSLQLGLRQIGEFENVVTSLKRIVAYTAIKPEKDKLEFITSANWPYEGKIEFRSVSLRYSDLEPWVLNKLNFQIYENEKVGIYGKSGAGKTSLISAICQLVETTGTILIDNINISKISLYNLRSKLCVIPQTPFLVHGTIRKNLDPFDQYSDEEIWGALKEVQLHSLVSTLPSCLSYRLYEDGYNLSVGQRQLLALARAILQKEKILIMDEATSHVDPQTDSLIQKTFQKIFAHNTVLQISRRFESIIGSDRIMVIDGGEVVEFDHPYNLLSNTNSLFYVTVKYTNAPMLTRLLEVAETNYKNKKKLSELD